MLQNPPTWLSATSKKFENARVEPLVAILGMLSKNSKIKHSLSDLKLKLVLINY